MKKSGFVTIVGKPNVGKSTLLNTLIGQKLAITSYKPQTTRRQMRAIYTGEQGQIVFLDTPGMNADRTGSAAGTGYTGYFRTQLGEYMEDAAESALKGSDIILMLIEPKPEISAEEAAILSLLPKSGTPVFLAINKMDTVSRELLGRVIEVYAAAFDFREIIPVSARKNKGTKDLLDTIFRYLPEGEPFYDEELVTDARERDLVEDIIREKALRLLQDEVPHGIAVTVGSMKYRKSRGGTICDITADVITEKETHKAIIIGRGGEMLRKIGTAARIDAENLLGSKVNLKLWVKVRSNWRDNEQQLRSYGYDRRDLKK